MNHNTNTISILDKVYKPSKKPFKSGKRVNTVKERVSHPITGRDSFTFYEDDSIVETRMCKKYID